MYEYNLKFKLYNLKSKERCSLVEIDPVQGFAG